MPARYVPDRGDIIWLTFDPQAGHEQAGRWPALVLSPRAYNAKAGLALICPITNRQKSYPFEVALPKQRVTGVVLADQLRSLDWSARRTEKAAHVDDETLQEVLARIAALLQL